MNDLKKLAQKERAKRQLEKKYLEERNDLYEYIKTYFQKEKNSEFHHSWHNYVLADALMKVYEGKTKRLLINIPPRMSKSEFVSKCFPTWVLGKKPSTKFIVTGYSSTLTESLSGEARDYYKSKTYSHIFPRKANLKTDLDTKKWWDNVEGGQYYAMGAGGTITGIGADIIIIDDPLSADDRDSEVKRIGINNWFHNVLESRLNDKINGAIIIIMQRLHQDDLIGHLLEQEKDGSGDKWEKVIIPSIADEALDRTNDYSTRYGDFHREIGELMCPDRLPEEFLSKMKTKSSTTYSSQFQQNPIDKDSQEFHTEWFKYYDEIPSRGRVFTTVDPAFSKKTTADESAITTVKFDGDKLYVLEQTVGKYNPAELEDLIVHHVEKWRPEQVGVEAFQAQVTISFSLKRRLYKQRLYSTSVEEIRQSGDKLAKIRSLVPLYRNGLIYHNRELSKLEDQLISFPYGKNDDCPDSLQMALYLYELMPNTQSAYKMPKIVYNSNGMPIIK